MRWAAWLGFRRFAALWPWGGGLLPPGVSGGDPPRRRPLPGVPAHENEGYSLRSVLAAEVGRWSSPARLRQARASLDPHPSDHRARTHPAESPWASARHRSAHAAHLRGGREPQVGAGRRRHLGERLPHQRPALGHHLGLPVSELRSRGRTQPRGPRERTGSALTLMCRNHLNWPWWRRLPEWSHSSNPRSFRASGGTLRVASHGRRRHGPGSRPLEKDDQILRYSSRTTALFGIPAVIVNESRMLR